jgi:nicotinate-nucleotide adenylyltransferase
MRALELAELRLVPARIPPHRQPPSATPEQRLEMARLACAEFPGFVVDDRELRREGPSYTVDTLQSLRAEVGEQPLCWLMGADAFGGIESWHDWVSLPELAHLVVMHRPGWEVRPAQLPEWARLRLADTSADLARAPAGRLWFQPVTLQDISATRVRAAVAHHEPVTAWLPVPVADFIRTHHVYLNSES